MQHVQWRQWPAFDAMLIVLHCCVHHNYSSCSSVVHEDDRKLTAKAYHILYTSGHARQLDSKLQGVYCHLVPCITQTCHVATSAAVLDAQTAVKRHSIISILLCMC